MTANLLQRPRIAAGCRTGGSLVAATALVLCATDVLAGTNAVPAVSNLASAALTDTTNLVADTTNLLAGTAHATAGMSAYLPLPIAKFFEFFGLLGTLSVLAWLAALAAMVHSRRLRSPWPWLIGALGAVILAGLFARITHSAIMESTLDDREEQKRTLAMNMSNMVAAAKAEAVASGSVTTTTGILFAEESTTDVRLGAGSPHAEDHAGVALSNGGLSVSAPSNAVGAAAGSNAAVTAEGDDSDDPAYRKQGKVERAKGKKQATKLDTKVEVAPPKIWYLKEKDYFAARTLSRVNLLCVDAMWWACLCLLGLAYLRDFNNARKARYLVPIGGHWMDSLAPKKRLVLITPAGAGALTPGAYAAGVLRRNENVVYFGPRDPWPESASLARTDWHVGLRTRGAELRAWLLTFPWGRRCVAWGSALRAASWTAQCVRCGAKVGQQASRVTRLLDRVDMFRIIGRWARRWGSWLLRWPVTKLVADRPQVPPGNEFLLDGAWFGRYAVVVTSAQAAPGMLADLVELLWQRHESGAMARQTVHLVWALPGQPSAEILADLNRMGAATNVRLVVWKGENQVPDDLRKLYDEVCDRPLESEKYRRKA